MPHWAPLDPLKAVFAASNCVNLNLRNYQWQSRPQVVTLWHFGEQIVERNPRPQLATSVEGLAEKCLGKSASFDSRYTCYPR